MGSPHVSVVLWIFSDFDRGSFSVREFAADHHLGKPIAINFFEAKYDENVDIIQDELRST